MAHKAEGTTNTYKHDDTPRAFARMMQLQTTSKRQRSGPDDGEQRPPNKRRKADGPETGSTGKTRNTTIVPTEKPKILPGERLGDFAARVDQAMPVGNLKRKGNVKVEGIKERQTKTEKRLHKMYAAWREEDARWKEKVEEQLEEEEEAAAELGEEGIAFVSSVGKRKQRAERDDDPWQELNAMRAERSRLHDVVQAPPTFKVIPKEKFKTKNGAKVDVENVPTSAGSLKRREELSEARKEVIERYRAMMGKGKN